MDSHTQMARRSAIFIAGSLVVFMWAFIWPSDCSAETIYFTVAENPLGKPFHHDSYVLPLSKPHDIEHARRLIAEGPEIGGAIVVASVVEGADGINRNVLVDGEPLWNWHVSEFQGFADFTIEIYDGWPTFIEEDVEGWIQNTKGPNAEGMVGFWGYTIVAEIVPEPSTLSLACFGALAIVAVLRYRR